MHHREAAGVTCTIDETIMEIVSDELEAFFEGARSKEDTAEHVEKRVSRYLEE